MYAYIYTYAYICMHIYVCICTYMYSRPRWAENCWALCWTVDRNQYSSISLYLLINSNNNRYYIIVTGSRPISGRSSVRDRKHNKSQILKWIRYFTLIRNLFAIFPYRPIWDYKIRCYCYVQCNATRGHLSQNSSLADPLTQPINM